VSESGLQKTQGGAIGIRLGVQLNLTLTSFVSNVARGGNIVAMGGAIFAEAFVLIDECSFLGNKAIGVTSSLSSTAGGAIAIEVLGSVVKVSMTINNTSFDDNRVLDAAVQNQGGAIWVGDDADFLLVCNSKMTANVADGVAPAGGAIFSSAEKLMLQDVVFLYNRAVARRSSAQGGAVFLPYADLASIQRCTFLFNVVQMQSNGAISASGGAVFADFPVRTIFLSESQLAHNTAGGIGRYQTGKAFTEVDRRYKARSAGQLHLSASTAVLTRCRFLEDGSTFDPRPTGSGDSPAASSPWTPSSPAEWWIVATSRTTLDECVFVSSLTTGLINLNGDGASLLVRSSNGTNVTIGQGQQLIGMANSFFTHALSTTIRTVQPPDCETVISGERVCDNRALCESILDGGVRCSCEANSFRSKSGMLKDGRSCEQDAKVTSTVETESAMLVLRKPDALGSSLRLKFKVEGENPVRARMSVILRRLVDGKEADVRSGVSIAQVAISAFGQHITWRRSIPEADWSVALDGASFKTAVVVQHEFSVHFNCSDGFDCAHDGDTLETIFSLDLPNERDEPKGAVTLYTRVEALPSCDHTVVQVIGLGSPDSLQVHVSLFDVDHFEVPFTRAKVDLRWGGVPIPFTWRSGSNLYMASVPTDLSRIPGTYVLDVVLLDAWSNLSQAVTPTCTLLKMAIVVNEVPGFQTAWLLVGALAAAALLIAAALWMVRKHSDQLHHVLGMVRPGSLSVAYPRCREPVCTGVLSLRWWASSRS
jgi:hypothetical protein